MPYIEFLLPGERPLANFCNQNDHEPLSNHHVDAGD